MNLTQKLGRKLSFLALFSSLAIFSGLTFAADELPALLENVRPEPFVYLVQEGDSLASVAESILGSRDFASELANYNNLEQDIDFSTVTTLVIPGVERNHAITAMWKASDFKKAAVEVGAHRFAKEAFANAGTVFGATLKAFGSADYLRARALGLRARDEYAKSIEEANANALTPRDATVVAVSGSLVTSLDGWKTSKSAKAGDVIPVEAQLRTGPDSRAEIRLPDGSTFYLAERTEIGFTMKEDQRNGTMDTQLQINLGEIFGKIKPKKKGSKFRIKNGRSAIVIRGTNVRTSRTADGWFRSMTLKGETEVLDEAGKVTGVNGGYGIYAKPDKPFSKPVGLLDPPKPLYPTSDVETTHEQVVTFTWKRILSWRLEEYLVELSRDASFIDMVLTTHTDQRSLQSPVLSDGEYYWRISSLDKNGLQGDTSKPVKFVVKTDLSVVLISDKAPLQKDGHLWLAPMTVVVAEPGIERSSVVAYEYSVNDTDFNRYDAGVVLKTHGTYTVVARGIGKDDRRGTEARRLYQVDGKGPVITMTPGAIEEHPVKGPLQLIAISAADDSEVSAVEYSIDGASWRRVSGPVYRPAGAEVDLRVRASDAFGNVANRRLILERLVEEAVKPSFGPR